MTKFFIYIIEFYQKIAPKKYPSCVFLPTCSEYTKQAILKYGFFYGFSMGLRRIFRCHPWQKNHYDPVK
jgi:putative membrane protein insertion efficiency factor